MPDVQHNAALPGNEQMKKTDIAKSIHQRLLNIRDETGEDFNSILDRYGWNVFFTELCSPIIQIRLF